jgi:hypothetical protein
VVDKFIISFASLLIKLTEPMEQVIIQTDSSSSAQNFAAEIQKIHKIHKGEITLNDVQDKIITIQNKNVLLDSDVAWLYGVETKRVNEAANNNPHKFPNGYILELIKMN